MDNRLFKRAILCSSPYPKKTGAALALAACLIEISVNRDLLTSESSTKKFCVLTDQKVPKVENQGNLSANQIAKINEKLISNLVGPFKNNPCSFPRERRATLLNVEDNLRPFIYL